ncbi:uncharacterized protein LOC129586517 [Paramacrobiotus metropolitanus]|uniref:uncharacterized protein LOC129586517 n=1 Tax=Paramacrobiotus metropolitanus TaxID=2943436 RepID=UPI002446589E|nr:uncharacterized protein LOC129586517 [Paramacrobiotus metropolitanus]XP_055335780.1 uncharacterized protein LOC129586517 [Paramacrobiotus metropolitanus]
MDTKNSKSRIAQQSFPFSADLSPQRMPPEHYAAVDELELIDLYGMDMRIANEETWLSGEQMPPRRAMGFQRSSSMDSINDAAFFLEHSELLHSPFHSTPHHAKEGENGRLNGRGDGTHVETGVIDAANSSVANSLARQFHDMSPIKNQSPLSGHRLTEGAGKPQQLKTSNANFDKMAPNADAEQLNGTFSKESMSPEPVNKTFEKEIKEKPKAAAPVKPTIPTSKQPVKGNAPASKGILRAPGPPVTKSTKNPGMNRATSLGNISGTEKKLAVNNGVPAGPGRADSNPALKAPVVSKIPRPAVRLPAPSVAVPSRIPKPGVKK